MHSNSFQTILFSKQNTFQDFLEILKTYCKISSRLCRKTKCAKGFRKRYSGSGKRLNYCLSTFTRTISISLITYCQFRRPNLWKQVPISAPSMVTFCLPCVVEIKTSFWKEKNLFQGRYQDFVKIWYQVLLLL